SLVASATAMGILVPPACFMILLGQITDTSVVGIFLAGFIPAAVTALCLFVVIIVQAHRLSWPKDGRPSWRAFWAALRESLVPMVVPVVIVAGFYFGAFTATEAGALVAFTLLVTMFGMVMEGLPAAVVLIPVVFPTAKRIGIHPIHFDIVLTAAVGIGLFLPPMGVGLLMAIRFARVSVGRHFGAYWPYLIALFAGLLLLIVFPEITLVLPRRAGLIR